MKGFVLLSVPRSGTTWLGSLTNATGMMGNFSEWLNSRHQKRKVLSLTAEHRFDETLSLASTANGRFAIKVFAPQLRDWHIRSGNDFIQQLRDRHEVSFFVLERKDRLRHAISLMRAEQSGAWAYKQRKQRQDHYDYDKIAMAYFRIEEDYAFWRSYLAMQGIEHGQFSYEELLHDPTPYINAVAAALDVAPPTSVTSRHRIQRDDLTEQWAERFQREAHLHNLLETVQAPSRTPRNFIRFLRRQAL